MAIPSRVLASGNSGLATTSICGDGATGLVALGTTAADALQPFTRRLVRPSMPLLPALLLPMQSPLCCLPLRQQPGLR